MEDVTLHFFPFPHVFRGERRDGLKIKWAKACSHCDRQCEHAPRPGLQMCSYGVNYERVDQDLLVAGVVVRDWLLWSSARKKALSAAGSDTIVQADLERAIERAAVSRVEQEQELRARKDAVIAEYRTAREYQAEIIEKLRPEIQAALGQVHDYKEFVQQIVQNMNVILETRFPDEDFDVQLDKAAHEEVAIYWAARLMEEKLDAALYVMYPVRINEERDRSRFRFHGMVTKYRKIYQRRLQSKGLTFRLDGESRGYVEGNARAIAIIPHCLLDNAIKYAPAGTEVVIDFVEDRGFVTLKVGSFGPRIDEDERDSIFDLFVRGRHAGTRDREGTGFGLGSAQTVAKAIGTHIMVKQDSQKGPDDTFWTEFSVQLRLAE